MGSVCFKDDEDGKGLRKRRDDLLWFSHLGLFGSIGCPPWLSTSLSSVRGLLLLAGAPLYSVLEEWSVSSCFLAFPAFFFLEGCSPVLVLCLMCLF